MREREMKLNKSKKTQILLLLIACMFILFTSGPTFYFTIYSWMSGKNEIQRISQLVIHNESNSIKILHNIADWLDENIEYDQSKSYQFGWLKIRRKIPPNAQYTVIVKRGACEEYAVLFKAISCELGFDCRVIHNPGEDHSWNEVMINGSWIHFDSTLTSDNRFNNTGHYERPRFEGGWGKKLSYVFFQDKIGEQYEVTKKYTNTGTLIIEFNNSKFPIFDIDLIIKSKSLMEWKPDKYKNPIKALKKNNNDVGQYQLELGGNNYIIVMKWGLFKSNIREYEISLQENEFKTLYVSFARA